MVDTCKAVQVVRHEGLLSSGSCERFEMWADLRGRFSCDVSRGLALILCRAGAAADVDGTHHSSERLGGLEKSE